MHGTRRWVRLERSGVQLKRTVRLEERTQQETKIAIGETQRGRLVPVQTQLDERRREREIESGATIIQHDRLARFDRVLAREQLEIELARARTQQQVQAEQKDAIRCQVVECVHREYVGAQWLRPARLVVKRSVVEWLKSWSLIKK